MIQLDSIDKRILMMLQENARMTIKDMAGNLEMSNTPVFERIKRLEKNGVIERYVALLSKEKLGLKITAFVEISLKDHAKKAVDEFVSHIEGFDEIMEIYHTTGESDFMIKVVVKDMEHYNEFITYKLPVVPNLGKMNSKFALTARKTTTEVKIP